MKFLCIPCDVKMEVQVDGIMPEEKTNLVMKFKCKKCGHSIAMLTNKFETEFVSWEAPPMSAQPRWRQSVPLWPRPRKNSRKPIRRMTSSGPKRL